MSLKYLFCLTLTFTLLSTSLQTTNLMYDLEPNDSICFHEYFSDKVLVIFEIFSNVEETDIKLTNPEEVVVSHKLNVNKFKESFTTFIGGYYEVCITNNNRETTAEITFNLKHGVGAKDYSSVAKSKDLKPMELDVRIYFYFSFIN